MKYIKKVLLGLDQFGNTLLGGYPDETISARAGRNRGGSRLVDKLFWTPLAVGLDKLQPNHVEGAIESEETGRQQAPEYGQVYDPDDKVVEPGPAPKPRKNPDAY